MAGVEEKANLFGYLLLFFTKFKLILLDTIVTTQPTTNTTITTTNASIATIKKIKKYINEK